LLSRQLSEEFRIDATDTLGPGAVVCEEMGERAHDAVPRNSTLYGSIDWGQDDIRGGAGRPHVNCYASGAAGNVK
jgi:hypothetical protein